MIETIVHRYVDSAVKQLERQGIRSFPGDVPEEMRGRRSRRSSDRLAWNPVTSTVTDGDLDAIEAAIGHRLPPVYRVFLQYKHFYELTSRGVGFTRHVIHAWKKEWMDLHTNLVDIHRDLDASFPFIPIGRECAGDIGDVCFDTRVTLPGGDHPVVSLDHELYGKEEAVHPMFSSGVKMFECLLIAAEHDLDFTHASCDDSWWQMRKKRKLMAQFLAKDPEGAGGPARGYWTGWGVDPAG